MVSIGVCIFCTDQIGESSNKSYLNHFAKLPTPPQKTESGSSFMTGFNQFYYSFSPTIADLERESPVFKEIVKLTITPLVTSLSILNYLDMDSEAKVLGYGIGLILLNVGMYIVTPIGIGIVIARKF